MIPQIKERITCVEYAQRVGLPVHKPGDRCVSPIRSEAKNKNSFVIYESFFYDFGATMGGDVIDLCAILAHNGDRKAAVHELAKLTGVEAAPTTDWIKATNRLNGQIERWHQNLTQDARDYMHSRRIADETIAALKIGFTGKGESDGYCSKRISIPYWKNGYIYSYVARASQIAQDPKYLKRRNDELSDRAAPWGMHTLDRTDRPLVIAEGAFDALSFYQEGYPVLATMGGHFSRDQLSTVLSVARNFPVTYLTFDADGPGAAFTLTLARALFDARIPFRVSAIPRPHKDVSDYYAAGGDLEDLFMSAQDGPTMLFLATTDESSFKALAFHAARFIDSPELAKLFSAVRKSDHFDDGWLSALQKQCEKPPSEDVVARSVMRKHELKYRENAGFYEYSRGAWRRISDTQVQGYISHELGRHRTGSKLSSILKIVKADTATEQPFDRGAVFNFINGTLELSDPPVFREHRKEDLCSIQANYPYDPHAHSPAWSKFVSDVCADDDKRAQLLQEIAGYVLFPDCSLEKMFVLQGEGGNGKSIFLAVLQAVYGKENASSVTATGICQDFQRIQLSTSLFNIASEIKSSLAGAEEYLKQVASGDTISACYKGQNFINFNPRCKMFFATNGQLKSQDTSDGLLRRLTLINFTQQFVDHPTKPHERKRDTQLLPKLLDSLPAIFNWCLQGYIMLLRTRDFTTMEDEEQAKADFMEASNPLISFMKDVGDELHGEVSKDALYQMYSDWCLASGHHKGSKTYLTREIKRLLPKGTQEVDTFRDGKHFRGYLFPYEVEQKFIPL